MSCLIIIPAFNVENEILPVLKGLIPYKDNVIFIDDGSTDITRELILKYNYNLIVNERNLGVSKSIIKGLKYAKEQDYNKIILMDSDGQHNPKYLPEIMKTLDENKYVFCSRFHPNNLIPSVKWNSNILGAIIVNEIWGTKYLDISCGFKAFHLNDKIYKKFEDSSGYQIVFDLFFHALNTEAEIATLKIDAVYDNSKFLSTRCEELIAFLCAIKAVRYKDFIDLKLDILLEQIINTSDFTFEINDMLFYGFYLSCKNTYILQSDCQKIHDYIIECMV